MPQKRGILLDPAATPSLRSVFRQHYGPKSTRIYEVCNNMTKGSRDGSTTERAAFAQTFTQRHQTASQAL